MGGLFFEENTTIEFRDAVLDGFLLNSVRGRVRHKLGNGLISYDYHDAPRPDPSPKLH